ncbi:thiol:disulfide interchange protein DsbA/DsbL [Ramlibacter albus]|uniref:Thiol:disulfide interchange protein n=1 Tax=Ramlibacter albus TaxID=2079448 RepID=A0A923M7E8_9BURK|nr:thiol:disulfide interchange protein DsbA/DsbL [Ramlibacter albus]MBC5764099.1 thiol:disulfide interchange protein DsbA/DsbL [Ramlibacter albus]
MHRREFTALALAAGVPALALAQKKPEDGTEYRSLAKRAAVEAPAGKIEVVEFFWYSCPHCNAFEPQLVRWSRNLPADAVLRRVPVGFRDEFDPQQRLFYTLQALGKQEELHQKIYDAIHKEKVKLERGEQIVDWVEKQGIDKAKFVELYTSPAMSLKARQATQLHDAYGIEGVPTLGIAGRWYTDGTLAGNMPRALQVTDFLIAEARKAP